MAASRRSRARDSMGVTDTSVEEVGLVVHDLVVEGLEAEPAGQVPTDLLGREARPPGVDLERGAGRLRHELHLARPLHRDVPPRRLVQAATDGEQTVVAEDGRL